MVTYMSIIRLKPGFDPDESYQLWRSKHSTRAKEVLRPELKKYTTARVIASFGEAETYGIARMEFDDLESCQRAFQRLLESPPDSPDPFASRIASVERIVLQEDEVEL